MTDRYDVVTSRKDKDGKFRSTKIGAAFVKGERISVVLDALPIGNSEGQAWLTLFPAKPKDDKAAANEPAAQDMNDSIPF
ncbi:hypothetical protein GA0061099_102137 [Bradyrhizobium yuanmingense]|uniref:DUF736 family protein n=1 Tax=Bradyrhizobium yuanmingense TaxID=108015 RepID=A0A1C3XHK7_9BRAD|nr:hypothetical protein [Bradyrhizobium yuanmingense]TWI18956.1 hypothetical protein IQ15_06980 [Bradyrhizobium yuanmingense]SCB51750.1 hypothetical protein GA0061099_102137 [Bradyrhizobium yuanmingense]